MSTAYILLDKLVFKFEGKTAITSNPGNSLLSVSVQSVTQCYLPPDWPPSTLYPGGRAEQPCMHTEGGQVRLRH